jgi:hypothetical protein
LELNLVATQHALRSLKLLQSQRAELDNLSVHAKCRCRSAIGVEGKRSINDALAVAQMN